MSMKHPPTASHNYLPVLKRRIEKWVKEGVLEEGGLSDVDICHDDWCDVHRSRFCNCNPDIRLWPKD